MCLLQRPDLEPHGFAQEGIQVAEGFVEQQTSRGEGSRYGDALLLAAAEVGGRTILVAGHPGDTQYFGDTFLLDLAETLFLTP